MDLDKLFYPESIAVVGASPNMGGGKIPYYQIQLAAGFKGRIYPVNPAHKEMAGIPVYPTLADVPGSVDLAIVSVPARVSVDTVRDAAKKGVKFMHFFTAGFSEKGDGHLEAELLKAAAGKVRIVGPNCIGVHCAESGVSFDPSLKSDDPGEVAFLGQSGGVTNSFARHCASRRIALNKVVSYGNQIDVRLEHYIEYLGNDDRIKVIAAYVEDIKNGRAFLDIAKKVTAKKPVVILKGGSTDEGAKAARSHTGAMACKQEIWSAAMRQAGCIEVDSFEEMLDVVMLAASQSLPAGPRVAYLGAGGGNSVLFTDLAVKAGLSMPVLEQATQDRIMEKIPDVNTSVKNPVDMGAFGVDYQILAYAMRATGPDQNIDVIVPFLSLDFVGMFKDDRIEEGLDDIIAAARESGKPVIPVVTRSHEQSARIEELRQRTLKKFRDADLPMFLTLNDAVKSIGKIYAWVKKSGQGQ